ncbi:cysteine hydrolase family protein [Algihabitans albus]|uniref:cysteine hydrolase family protein n=1 Tax=Algihabitans albus TaxID=2164067 RepID=UPI000E5D1C3C|nr:cysteine hydrolase family protein [Algihabitans albus]
MSQPQTLLSMAGAPATPPALAVSAVVMIDAQREYVDGRLPLPGVAAALDEGSRLLGAARQAGRPVIHVRHKGRAGGLFDPETTAYAIAEPVFPVGDEPVVTKALPNSFAGTELAELLAGLKIENLLIAGFMTHMCVSSTVRAATDLGYRAAVIAGACATRDLPDGQGGVVPADQLQRAELAALSDRFAVVVERAEEIPA